MCSIEECTAQNELDRDTSAQDPKWLKRADVEMIFSLTREISTCSERPVFPGGLKRQGTL
ncbi:hypothetical protein IFM47457_07676 [Aspergillus lentulus]|nr:hypothetical protein IFM47457_07676 [Aspergillus lentulus]